MTSQEIKAAFAAAGIKVRVKACSRTYFRVCTLDGSAHGPASQAAAASLGLRGADGRPGGLINQPHEMFTGLFRVVA